MWMVTEVGAALGGDLVGFSATAFDHAKIAEAATTITMRMASRWVVGSHPNDSRFP